MVGRTTFMVAHRLSTLSSSDVRLNVSRSGQVSIETPAAAWSGPERSVEGRVLPVAPD
jgi:hypothetical protein